MSFSVVLSPRGQKTHRFLDEYCFKTMLSCLCVTHSDMTQSDSLTGDQINYSGSQIFQPEVWFECAVGVFFNIVIRSVILYNLNSNSNLKTATISKIID